ncbi:MAG: YcnI family protein [Frankia sp.]
MRLLNPVRGRPWRRLAVVGAVAGLLAFAFAAPASAHVTVHADNPTQGASDPALAFRVPNERDNATTTKIEVQLPTGTPLLGVLVAPHPGWSSSVKSVKLNPPVKTDDGEVTDAVSTVTWTADSKADAIPVGDYADFDVTVGQLPDTPTLTFKALQTYSNGELVRWIGVSQAGQAEPDNPAPVLTLAPAAATTATPRAATPAATSGSSSSSDTTARVLGALGIALAIVFGIGGYLLGRRRPHA